MIVDYFITQFSTTAEIYFFMTHIKKSFLTYSSRAPYMYGPKASITVRPNN